MKKYILDLRVVAVEHPREGYALLKLTNDEGALPEMVPGQFVEVKVDKADGVFLRRPISINRIFIFKYIVRRNTNIRIIRYII